MAILKLANGPHTLTVRTCTADEGNFGPQVKFDDGQDCVFLSESAAEKQMARLGLTMETVIGKTLVFSQTVKDGRTYNNIDFAGSPTIAGATAAARQTATPAPGRAAAPPKDMPTLIRLYAECVDGAMMTLGAKLEAAQVPFDGGDIAAAAATLFIQANK
jgi:hypothetical protein